VGVSSVKRTPSVVLELLLVPVVLMEKYLLLDQLLLTTVHSLPVPLEIT